LKIQQEDVFYDQLTHPSHHMVFNKVLKDSRNKGLIFERHSMNKKHFVETLRGIMRRITSSNNSRLIDQEDIVFLYRREHYQLWWKEGYHDEDDYYTRNYSHYFIEIIRINFEEKPTDEWIIH